jgi:hypothetical protein
MADFLRSTLAELAGMARLFRLLNAEQRAAAVGALLLAVSTFGPFSFVEAAELLIAGGVLALLRARALGKRFHLPFGDGTVIAAAGFWAGALIVVRLFDRPLGQNLLALACAAILVLAGARERAKRPADDLPAEHRTPPIRYGDPDSAWSDPEADRTRRRRRGSSAPRAGPRTGPSTPAARQPAADEDETEPLPPPEFERYGPKRGE